MNVESPTAESHADSWVVPSADGIGAELTRLESLLQRQTGDSEGLASLRRLREGVNQLVAEHGGMAEELLNVYEQLGIVFEVTRRLPEVRDEPAVLELFLESLTASLQHYRVSLVLPDCDDHWQVRGADLEITSWLAQRMYRAVVDPEVFVAAPSTTATSEDMVEFMIAPALCGDRYLCAFVLARASGAPEFRSGDMSLVESLARFCGDIVRNHRLLNEVREMSLAMVLALVNAVDQKDEYTSGHSLRVAYYATLLGRELYQVEGELQMLQWSALLHDVGKIGIRDDVLKKEGKLSPAEMEHMREHPMRSYEVVKSIPRLKNALDGVLHHHERYDGSGYPHGLCGQEIPFDARIIQIADVFDALTSTRSYRPAFHWRKALDIMKQEAGTILDPQLQRLFDRLLRTRLETDVDAWPRMVAEGNRFTHDWPHPVTDGPGY